DLHADAACGFEAALRDRLSHELHPALADRGIGPDVRRDRERSAGHGHLAHAVPCDYKAIGNRDAGVGAELALRCDAWIVIVERNELFIAQVLAARPLAKFLECLPDLRIGSF